MTAVRAKYRNGVLTPLEPLDLEEGAEVMVSVEGAPEGIIGKESIDAHRQSFEERIKTTQSAAGGWKGGLDPEELKRMIYAARIAGSREPEAAGLAPLRRA